MADKLQVVRKLLAKAERAATAEEAEVYTAKAVELMARHGIDAALAGAADPGREPIGQTRIEVSDPYSAGKARLLGWTAEALGCRWVQHGWGGGRVAAVTLVGFASDRERAELLYTSLLLQATTQLTGARPVHRGESVAAYRRSWLHGFARSVHRRLLAAQQRAARTADAAGSGEPGDRPGARPSVALVLADRDDQVGQALAAAFPHLQRARPSTMSGSGAAAGWAAGEVADLGAKRVGGSRTGLAGRRAG